MNATTEKIVEEEPKGHWPSGLGDSLQNYLHRFDPDMSL